MTDDGTSAGTQRTTRLPPSERVLQAARAMFAARGFHSSPMSELAALADVSVGQVYRFFASKDDIIVAIATQDIDLKYRSWVAVCERVDAGEIGVEDALKILTLLSLDNEHGGFVFETLAEAQRNPRVAETIARATDGFRKVIRRLSLVVNPAFDADDLAACEEVLLAIQFGLGHRALTRSALSNEEIAGRVASMMIGALAVVASAGR